jgi:DNA-binding MarR family transcriptional regulator
MLLRQAYFALRRCSNAHASQFDANGDQFVLLRALVDRDGVTQQDLVEVAGYDASTIGNMLRSMETQGLITRDAHPEDGRAKIVHLTDKGYRRQRQLWEASETLRRRLWKCVRPEDREILGQTLPRIAEEMEAVRAEFEAKRVDQ